MRQPELAMEREPAPAIRDEQHGVVEAVAVALMDAEDDVDLQLARELSQRRNLGTVERRAVLEQTAEQGLGRFVVPDRDGGSLVQPQRIARQPGLREDNEAGTLGGGLPQKRLRLRDAVGKIEEHRGGLNQSDAQRVHGISWLDGADQTAAAAGVSGAPN
jgi:hypothetical protein